MHGLYFLTEPMYAVIACAVGLAIHQYVAWRDVDVNWGSATDAKRDVDTLNALYKMSNVASHAKIFRPAYLVLSGEPKKRPGLARFVSTLGAGHGCTVFTKFETETTFELFAQRRSTGYHPYYPEVTEDPGLRGFYNLLWSKSIRTGARQMMQTAGLGRIRPNTLVLGYKNDWLSTSDQAVRDYVGVIRDSFTLKFGCMICRGMETINWDATPSSTGYIDVWWLIDDGGLTVLVAWLMSMSDFWKKATNGETRADVRLFVVTQNRSLDKEQKSLSQLLMRFRIDWVSVVIGPHEFLPVTSADKDDFESWCPKSKQSFASASTQRFLKVAKIIRQKSAKKAKLLIVSLPFVKSKDDAHDYMSWLELLTRGMPPTVLMRGNGKDVLTFYSD